MSSGLCNPSIETYVSTGTTAEPLLIPSKGYKNILDLHELITNAQLTPLISAEFTLNQALDAIQYFNKRLSYGKIIILP